MVTEQRQLENMDKNMIEDSKKPEVKAIDGV